jgi:hypothetical protein
MRHLDPVRRHQLDGASAMTRFLVWMFIAAFPAAAIPASTALAQNVVDEWATVKAPPAPELKPVKVESRTTALLVLD